MALSTAKKIRNAERPAPSESVKMIPPYTASRKKFFMRICNEKLKSMCVTVPGKAWICGQNESVA